jgi:hypothetical protein
MYRYIELYTKHIRLFGSYLRQHLSGCEASLFQRASVFIVGMYPPTVPIVSHCTHCTYCQPLYLLSSIARLAHRWVPSVGPYVGLNQTQLLARRLSYGKR